VADDPLISGPASSEPGVAPAGRLPPGFRALRYPGFRLYFVGMLLRGTAVWMQLIGLPWYAVELHASPLELGVVTAVQSLPFLIVAPIGGVIADLVERGRVLLLAQLGVFVQSAILVVLVVTGSGTIPAIAVLGAISGVLIAVELPVRQAYLGDLVPPDDVTSAVSLHSTAFNTSRFIGPGVAGILIASVGLESVFATAAVFSLGVALTVVVGERSKPYRRAISLGDLTIREAFVEGARFAAAEPRIRTALLFVAAASIFAIQAFQTLAPLFVGTLGLDGGGYGAYMALWGGGAVVAAYLVTLLAHGDRRRWLFGGASALALLLGVLAVTTSVPLAFVLAALLGAGQIALVTNALVEVQDAVPDELRGRVLGFYTTLYQGTAPIGSILAGGLASLFDVRLAMLAGAAALGVAIAVGLVAVRAGRPAPAGLA
jgi:MFS family permease